MSEAELLKQLELEHFRSLERGDRYRILAQVGANPPPALALARYQALKPWLPQNQKETSDDTTRMDWIPEMHGGGASPHHLPTG